MGKTDCPISQIYAIKHSRKANISFTPRWKREGMPKCFSYSDLSC